MAFYDPKRFRRLMEKRSDNLVKRSSREGAFPLDFESHIDKDGQTIYKGFVFLPGTISDNIQQLKLHLPTGYIYCVKNDHCATIGCPGMFNRRGHNAHPIHSRIKMYLEAFRWQIRLFLLEGGSQISLKKAIEICYQDWPFEIEKSAAKLYDSLKSSLYTFKRASKEENRESIFMKKSFLQEYPQKKLDRLIAALRLNTHYWGPYTASKPAESRVVEKENYVVPTGKRRRENVSPLRNEGSVEKEMNPQKKLRQETDKDKDPKGLKTIRSSENVKAKNGEKIFNKSNDKAKRGIPEDENKCHRRKKISDGSKKKRNSDIESKVSSNSVRTSTPNGKGVAGLYGERETWIHKEINIPSSAEMTPISELGVSRESVEPADLMEVRRLLEQVRMEAERKSREAEHLKKALAHLLSYKIESDGSKLHLGKMKEIIGLDGKTLKEFLIISRPDQPKETANKLLVVSDFLSDSILPNVATTVSSNRPNLGNSFKNGRPWGPLSRRRLLPEERSFDEQVPEKTIRFAETLMKRSAKIFKQDGIDVFAVPLNKKSIEPSLTFERFVFGKADGQKEHRTVLVVGANGTERRKFIDGVINFVFSVEKGDNFRFKLIQEKDSQTNCIKVYDIHHCEGFLVPFSLTIVDTPNYDSYPEELEIFKEKQVIETFHEFLEKEESVEKLDMICSVQGSKISSSFLSVFASDLEENIHHLKPSDFMSDSWHDDIQTFVTLLSTMKAKSLSLTKQMLSGRKRLESTVYEIRSLITNGLALTEEMITAKQMVSNYQMKLQQIKKNVQPQVKQEAAQQVELPAGQFANNCNHCNVTCSTSVFMEVNGRSGYYWPLIDLSVSSEADYCTVCPEKCKWNVHSIKPYRMECVQSVTDDLSDNRKRNAEVESKWDKVYSTVLDMVNFLEEKISRNSQLILERFQTAGSCICSLDKISRGKLLSTKNLISFLFTDVESQLDQLGLKEQVNSLNTLFN